jgi:hypothetical protein
MGPGTLVLQPRPPWVAWLILHQEGFASGSSYRERLALRILDTPPAARGRLTLPVELERAPPSWLLRERPVAACVELLDAGGDRRQAIVEADVDAVGHLAAAGGRAIVEVSLTFEALASVRREWDLR